MKTRMWSRGWLSLGVTLVLLALVAIMGAAAQGPDVKPEVPVTVIPPPVEPGPAPSGGSLALAAGGPSQVHGFTYQGRLLDGSNPANGSYDFQAYLYTTAAGGSLVAACDNIPSGTLANVPVQNGLFTLYLLCGDWNSDVFTGGTRWLELRVRPSGIGSYVTLPRQPIAPTPYAWSLYPGATIEGYPPTLTGSVLTVNSLAATNPYASSSAILGTLATGYAVRGDSSGGHGIHGTTENGFAVYGYDGGSESARGYAGYFVSTNGVGVYGHTGAAGTAENWYSPGVFGEAYHGVGVFGRSTENADRWPTAGVLGWGMASPGGKFLSHTGNLIEGWRDVNGNGTVFESRFRVENDGDVYADGSFHPGGADLAEMLPADSGLEPGDVLAIGPDGLLVRSAKAYDLTVAGIYSTQPGIVGGAGDGESTAGKVPLAVVGVVPVKASAENGAIRPGDLLTSSPTPGHAMRAGENARLGTIIGKALGGLEEGTGTIPVLVTLQ